MAHTTRKQDIPEFGDNQYLCPRIRGDSLQTTVGKRLRELRRLKKLSQAALADKAGVSTRAIENWEQGVNMPQWEAIVKLAAALEVSTDEFTDSKSAT